MKCLSCRFRPMVVIPLCLLAIRATSDVPVTLGDEYASHRFDRVALTDVYYSEGIAAGDLNRDGHPDIVYGPYWFAGPEFKQKREIYPAKPQPRERYADHFFAWVYDFDGDGWNDVLTVGFPGTPGFVYQNPGADGFDRPWPKHRILDSVANESPQWTNLVGDDRPELVCTKDGFYGYATYDPAKPWELWKFHAMSEKIAPNPFGHGLGIGDVNGDGRLDILARDGWFEQPKTLGDDVRWVFHAFLFAPAGGAEMYAYDVDGDGDQDVITSLAAHEFGLAWYEQVRQSDTITFQKHLIMGDQPAHNRYGVVFSELHSVNLVDVDGDGLKDIVTGKTYWSHHMASPMWDAGAVVYWFRLVRGPDGVDWVPYKADGEAGVGRQLIAYDINQDGLVDLASGGMKGAHVLTHRATKVTAEQWKELQPKVQHLVPKQALKGTPPTFDEKSGLVSDALEGEQLKILAATGGKAGVQPMAQFKTGRWSGDKQLFWNGPKPGDRLELEVPVAATGTYRILAALTLARDYGIVQCYLDQQPLGGPLDLYSFPDVLSSGEVALGTRELAAGNHRLVFEVKGANPLAVKAHMFGLDYVRLAPQ